MEQKQDMEQVGAPETAFPGQLAAEAALPEQLAAQKRARVEIGQFAALFPGVGPRQVPQEVWQEVRSGQSLAMAYALWRIKTLEETLRRRVQSADLSAGSVSSAGSTTLGGTVASFWDAYEI